MGFDDKDLRKLELELLSNPGAYMTVIPVKEFQADEIRKATRMSQKTFASYLGVSDKTVEAWEAGTNHPSGAASRLLSMMEMNSNLVKEFPFVKVIEK